MASETDDHYSTLGVLPEAESIVITAAYRALAQRYHPDRWTGSPEEAHARMSRINAAYAVLSDPTKRGEYDRSRDQQSHSGYRAAQNTDTEFEDAISVMEERWRIACELYPDLDFYRRSLRRVSAALAFAYTNILLEKRTFAKRQELAAALEKSFLERYFSSNPKLIAFAKRLIEAAQRDALLELNRFIDVLGDGAEAERLIQLIDTKFSLGDVWHRLEAEKIGKTRREALIQRLKHSHDFDVAKELAELHGYEIGEVGHGLFQPTTVVATDKNRISRSHPNKATFVSWVKADLCR